MLSPQLELAIAVPLHVKDSRMWASILVLSSVSRHKGIVAEILSDSEI